MSVVAPLHAVALKDIGQINVFFRAVNRRIMYESNKLAAELDAFLQGSLQPTRLTKQHLHIRLLAVFAYPASGAADGRSLDQIRVVKKELYRAESVVAHKLCDLVHRGPPQIVVALDENLLTPQLRVDKLEILVALFQLQRPGVVAQQDDRIFIGDLAVPVGFDLFNMISPPGKNIHRLVSAER